jgi:hypothetical protein
MEESSAAVIAADEDSQGPLGIVSRLQKPDEVDVAEVLINVAVRIMILYSTC